MSKKSGFVGALLGGSTELYIAIAVVLMVFMLIFPLPTMVLDFLMVCNIVLSLIILLSVLYLKRPIDFGTFPTMLLISTVFSFALNVSSTRSILTLGPDFDGQMIRAFSSFVVGGAEGTTGLVVGFVIFIILIAIQAMVVTKGATRAAEVAARFSLDAMNFKMLSVDSLLNSGSITEEDARRRKEDIQLESNFYGNMDGANKFISGGVKVGILITVVNLVAGIIVGMIFRGEGFTEALETYCRLTIGDGLLAQVPSLLISVASGIIITKGSSEFSFGQELERDLLNDGKVYYSIAGILLLLSLVPAFPQFILLLMSILLGFLGYYLSKNKTRKEIVKKEKEAEKTAKAKNGSPGKISAVSPPDIISMEIGYALVPLVEKGGELLERITMIRNEVALDLGLTIPPVRIMDNVTIEPGGYRIKIRGIEVGRGEVRMGSYLCFNYQKEIDDIEGEKTIEPTFNLPALWISEENREKAERKGYIVTDVPSVMTTHMLEIIRRHAAEFIGRQEVQAMIDVVKKDYPAVVEEVMGASNPNRYDLGRIQKVLQGLLRENVSIRNFVVILETLADYAPLRAEPYYLVEKVRAALADQISFQYADEEKNLNVVTLSPAWEQKIEAATVVGASGPVLGLEPDMSQKFITDVNNVFSKIKDFGYMPIILTSEAVRLVVRNFLKKINPGIIVLGVPEISSEVNCRQVGVVDFE